jgi:PTS system ascorbate-specific IIA component
MPGFIIVAHAPLASALKAVATHTEPECARTLEVFDVPADMPPEEIEARIRALLAQVAKPDALIFTDLFGATPSNVLQGIADGVHVKVLAGVNVPMLLRVLRSADQPLDAVVARAMTGATQGVMQVATSRPQNQTFKPGGHGQDPDHDQ